jgi:hypothetical protein
LYDVLTRRFGDGHVFMDLTDIPPGRNFLQVIEEKIAASDVLLVLIGPKWAAITDERGRPRLNDPEDVVRLETAAALKRGIRAIPVLIAGAVMPRKADLPEDLKALADHQAHEITERHFRQDADSLIRVLSGNGRGRFLKAWLAAGAVAGIVALMAVAMWSGWLRWKPREVPRGGVNPPVSSAAPPNESDAAKPQPQGKPESGTPAAGGPPPPAPVETPRTSPGEKKGNRRSSAGLPVVDIQGVWAARVQYGRAIAGGEPVWEEKYAFRFVGGELIGTATMFEYPHPLRDAQLRGRNIAFSVHQSNGDGSNVRELKYRGEVDGDSIRFTHQDMYTGRITEFTAARTARY